jgi:anti-sigma B factor antagonist
MLAIYRDTQADRTAVCRVVGEVDSSTASRLRQVLAENVGVPRLVIDLSDVTFVDSVGLGALVGGIRRTREGGGDVALACNRPVLVRLLRHAGFDKIVTIAATSLDATRALQRRGRGDTEVSVAAGQPRSPASAYDRL